MCPIYKIAFNVVRTLIILLSLLLLSIGLRWLFLPETMTTQAAVIPNGLLGWATFRADFGAFFVVGGITGILATLKTRGANYYLICCAMLIGFAALGRLIGFVSDGVPAGGVTPLIVELTTLALLTALASLRVRLDRMDIGETAT